MLFEFDFDTAFSSTNMQKKFNNLNCRIHFAKTPLKKKNAQNLMKAIVCSLFVKILFYHYIVCYWIAVFILDLPLETATSEKDCLQPIM